MLRLGIVVCLAVVAQSTSDEGSVHQMHQTLQGIEQHSEPPARSDSPQEGPDGNEREGMNGVAELGETQQGKIENTESSGTQQQTLRATPGIMRELPVLRGCLKDWSFSVLNGRSNKRLCVECKPGKRGVPIATTANLAREDKLIWICEPEALSFVPFKPTPAGSAIYKRDCIRQLAFMGAPSESSLGAVKTCSTLAMGEHWWTVLSGKLKDPHATPFSPPTQPSIYVEFKAHQIADPKHRKQKLSQTNQQLTTTYSCIPVPVHGDPLLRPGIYVQTKLGRTSCGRPVTYADKKPKVGQVQCTMRELQRCNYVVVSLSMAKRATGTMIQAMAELGGHHKANFKKHCRDNAKLLKYLEVCGKYNVNQAKHLPKCKPHLVGLHRECAQRLFWLHDRFRAKVCGMIKSVSDIPKGEGASCDTLGVATAQQISLSE